MQEPRGADCTSQEPRPPGRQKQQNRRQNQTPRCITTESQEQHQGVRNWARNLVFQTLTTGGFSFRSAKASSPHRCKRHTKICPFCRALHQLVSACSIRDRCCNSKRQVLDLTRKPHAMHAQTLNRRRLNQKPLNGAPDLPERQPKTLNPQKRTRNPPSRARHKGRSSEGHETPTPPPTPANAMVE